MVQLSASVCLLGGLLGKLFLSLIIGTDAETVLSHDSVIQEATVKLFPPLSHLIGSELLRNVASQLWNKEPP